MSTIKPFLLLQLRPEDEAAEDEAEAFTKFAGLQPENVECIRMEKTGIPPINLADYSGIIIAGGPSNVSDGEESKSSEQKRFETDLDNLLGKVIAADFPLLGTCYGLGKLADHLGGQVSKEQYGEDVGAITIELTEAAKDDPLTADLPRDFRAFAGHKEACQSLPPGATLLASSTTCPVQIIRVKDNIYATQFHTELDKAGLALRINVYKHAGYFPPEAADMLIAASHNEEVTTPEVILKRFAARYAQAK